uniref:Uncharacterized protein n=1 Tax=Globisporangium ultimum (strain ATCC 200006 / CBS 805.95 / DAOM BR144) TaxID=431595 RepID=K3WS54_GLOUD
MSPKYLPGAAATVQTGNQRESGKATDAKPQGSADATAAASTSASSTALGKKRARYLRDTDRRDIIQRIENGEKQASLAREFGVTRAAICHIKKNRDEIITRYDLLVQSAKDLILLEEATASFSSTPLEVLMSSGDVFQGLEAPSESFCGVSVGDGGHSFLKLFHQMEPEAATGYIHLLESVETAQKQSRVIRTDLPPNIRGCNVLLFLATSNDGERVCKSIEAMRRLDVPETSICVVLLLCTADAIAAICTKFPHVKIITSAIDADARSGLGDFVARYNA